MTWDQAKTAYENDEIGWDILFESMTDEQAAFVRNLRCNESYSWRGVAHACNKAWNGDWDQNQIAGIAICAAAADRHDEDHNAPPWN